MSMMYGLLSLGRRLLKSDEFTDCALECEGVIYKLHRVIICMQSPVFFQYFSGQNHLSMPMITLTGIDCECLECMIQAMYTGDYTLPARKEIVSCRNVILPVPDEMVNAATNWPLVRHARVFVVATQYKVDGLQQLARDHYQMTLRSSGMIGIDFLESLFDIFMQTSKRELMLRQVVLDFLVDRPEWIRYTIMEGGIEWTCIMNGITDTRYRRLLSRE